VVTILPHSCTKH